ncbi:MAG: inositol monophosphatase, partial [Calditrichaeota bacterium]
SAILIVSEAGGKVTKIDLREYSIFSDQILASNTLIHKQMADVLSSKKA